MRIVGLEFIAIAVATVAAPLPARAGTETFPDFSTTTDLTLSGNAAAVTTADGPVLRLTSAAPAQVGSVFSSVTVNPTTFSTAFAFKISDPGGVVDPDSGRGADGLVFVIQALDASLGNLGSGLGIEGVKPSVAVEFDTWKNRAPETNAADPSSNHVGVDLNGDVKSVITAEVPRPMNNGRVWYAWIDYDGSVLTLRLGDESSARPSEPLLSYKIDIPAVLGVAQAHVGLAASTAAAWQNHDILRWTYQDSFVDAGVGPDTSIGVEPDGGTWDFDAGSLDDAGSSDGALPLDAASDVDAAAPNDAGMIPGEMAIDAAAAAAPHGCSCEVAPGAGANVAALLMVGAFLAMSRRRRRR